MVLLKKVWAEARGIVASIVGAFLYQEFVEGKLPMKLAWAWRLIGLLLAAFAALALYKAAERLLSNLRRHRPSQLFTELASEIGELWETDRDFKVLVTTKTRDRQLLRYLIDCEDVLKSLRLLGIRAPIRRPLTDEPAWARFLYKMYQCSRWGDLKEARRWSKQHKWDDLKSVDGNPIEDE